MKTMLCSPAGRALCLAAVVLAPMTQTLAGGDDFRRMRSDANVYVVPGPSDIRKIAIMPFKAPTELIGSSVSDMFVTDMMRAGRYELVERSQMAQVLNETELAMAGLSAAKAVEVASMLGAEGVVIGTVDEYSTIAQRGSAVPVVGISLRLIDCKTAKVVWSADLAKRADKRTLTLGEHARAVVHEITAGLYREWRNQPQVARASSTAGTVADAPAAQAAAPAPPPATPHGIQVSDMGLREVYLKWTVPATPPDRYVIYRADNAAGPFAEIARVSPSKGAFLDTGSRHTPLADGKTYYYRLIAVDRNNLESPPTKPIESMTAPVPEPPEQLLVDHPAARAAKVSWTVSRAEGVERYLVERAIADDNPIFVKVGEVKGTEFAEGGTSDSPLMDSTAYFYRVTAINRVGAVGDPSKPVRVTTHPPPAVVEAVTAESGGVRCVPLEWKASPEDDVVAYEIQRLASPDAEATRLATVKGRLNTKYLDGLKDPGNLRDAFRYLYQVRAMNKVGSVSTWSPAVEANTRPPPPEVTGVMTSSGRPRIVPLIWKASPDEKTVGYEIRRAEAGTETFALIADLKGREVTSYTDRNGATEETLGRLADGTEYSYQVLAYNTAGARSTPSAPCAARTKPAPQPPADVAATTQLPRAIQVTWKPNSETDIAEYLVEGRDADASRFHPVARIAADQKPSVLDDRLGDGVHRDYQVKAFDKDGLQSAFSALSSGSTKAAPGAPTALQAEWKEAGPHLAWTPPAQTDIVEYRVFRKGLLRAEPLAQATTASCTLDPAKVGRKANVFVVAVDKDGLESARSEEAAVVAPPAAGP